MISLILFVGAVLFATTIERAVAVILPIIPCLAASLLWFSRGASGVPITVMVCLNSTLYYSLPVITGAKFLEAYAGNEILEANMSVAIFMIFWAASSFVVANVRRHNEDIGSVFIPDHLAAPSALALPILIGLSLGCAFQIVAMLWGLNIFGSLGPILRAVCVGASSLSAFLLGCALGKGRRNVTLIFAFLLLIVYAALSCASLLLIYGALAFIAAVGGYILSSRKIPFAILILLVCILTVFNAGKNDMRAKYWQVGTSWNTSTTVLEVPGLMAEWFGVGVVALFNGTNERSIVERATLLDIVLLVRHYTPETLPFLGGVTYAEAPLNAVPRVFNEQKGDFHKGTVLLGIYYGLQTHEGSTTASIAFGLIAEAWANFGYLGLIFVGSTMGLLSGWLERLSSGRTITSFPTLLAFSVGLNLFNLENDSGTLAAILPQTCVAAFVFSRVIEGLVQQRLPRAAPQLRPVRR